MILTLTNQARDRALTIVFDRNGMRVSSTVNLLEPPVATAQDPLAEARTQAAAIDQRMLGGGLPAAQPVSREAAVRAEDAGLKPADVQAAIDRVAMQEVGAPKLSTPVQGPEATDRRVPCYDPPGAADHKVGFAKPPGF